MHRGDTTALFIVKGEMVYFLALYTIKSACRCRGVNMTRAVGKCVSGKLVLFLCPLLNAKSCSFDCTYSESLSGDTEFTVRSCGSVL